MIRLLTMFYYSLNRMFQCKKYGCNHTLNRNGSQIILLFWVSKYYLLFSILHPCGKKITSHISLFISYKLTNFPFCVYFETYFLKVQLYVYIIFEVFLQISYNEFQTLKTQMHTYMHFSFMLV